VQKLDFTDLPADVVPASGLFVTNADASRIVTFGNRPGRPPLSLAILWGYTDVETPSINMIDPDSVMRFLSDDGRCLYAGYRQHYIVWELNPNGGRAAIAASKEIASQGIVVNLWHNEAGCSTELYAEIVADDGSTAILAPDLSVLHTNLFATTGGEPAARVGRIQPPLALTMTFDGMLYQWDMNAYKVTAQVFLGELAMFGAVNHDGAHYAWLQTDYSGLHLVDFETETDRFVAALNATYISHIKLTHNADVILGVDPFDQPGTVSAWIVETGERIDLGAFRHCQRTQPDLVELSQDGTALVIGCDTGIDIWRVEENQATSTRNHYP
jgi:hypothetical protein